MEKTVPELIAAISPEEWAQVPVSVLKLIEELVRRMDKIEQEVAALRTENELLKEQLARTSANSSQPPSKNSLTFKPNRKEPTGKKRGGQIGHIGHERKLYPVEVCQEVIDHYPAQCSKCGSEVSESISSQAYRHQVVEIPPVQPIITEHRFHQITCSCCGTENQASIMPEIIGKGGYGARVAAYVGLFSSQYRQSYRQIQKIMEAVFGIEMSLGTINNLRTEVSELGGSPAQQAVSGAVTDAQGYIQQQPIVGVDETGFKQRNGDGQNATKTSGWLWVAVTPLIICFQVILSRASTAAQTVLGSTFAGFITSDRCPAYNWVDIANRQICWAHLKRDFIQISERTGVSAEIGESLLVQEKLLFNLWYQFRNEQLTRSELVQAVEPIQAKFLSILTEAAELQIDGHEKTPLAKTVRTCRNLLKLEIALWLFVREEGVEPTNNAAERAIRPAVIWRRTSFGSDSAAGSEFVSRLLTVVSSLNLQERNILDFLVESISAARSGEIPPSLLP
ncbi:IS66 family transposase [Chamaesiphon sp.]|uniref:IS66 family transposase n=1 Tax=Chamaesiphon sp. TaxID=2814140 RepID=UPI003593DE6B